MAAEGATPTTCQIILRSIGRKTKAQKGPRTFLRAQGRPDSSFPQCPARVETPSSLHGVFLWPDRVNTYLAGGQVEASGLAWGKAQSPRGSPTSSITQDGSPKAKGLVASAHSHAHSLILQPRGKEVKGADSPVRLCPWERPLKQGISFRMREMAFPKLLPCTAQSQDAVLGPQGTGW